MNSTIVLNGCVAQLVRAADCGSVGHGFNSRRTPKIRVNIHTDFLFIENMYNDGMSENAQLKIATCKDLLKVTIIEKEEKMVNISKILTDCICLYEKNDMIPYLGSDLWIREEVAKKLDKISKKLKRERKDYKLKIVYGYRHPEVQEKYFTQRKITEKKLHPDLGERELIELTHKKVAFPEVAGHPTGGAIDLTITTPTGDLDMGTKIADFSDPEKIKTYTNSVSENQKANREILHDLMAEEEFAPFYEEWWHFSYGDREWAWFYDKADAIYDTIFLKVKSDNL